MTTNKPVYKYRLGAVSGSVWKNEKEGRVWYTVSTQRSYKVGEEWKNTDSLMTNNIADAILVLQNCYTWIKTQSAIKEGQES